MKAEPAGALRMLAVVPVLNEAARIADCLAPLRAAGARVLVADGGSTDDTAALAQAAGAEVLRAPKGRARQMNAGAQAFQPPDEPTAQSIGTVRPASRGDDAVLLFVHADTVLPPGWRPALEAALEQGVQWGRFDVRLDSRRPLLRLVGAMMNLRSRWTGICTGDQAIFVRGDLWLRCGGYADIPLMEDIELSGRLRRLAGRPAAISSPVRVSARRWEQRGVLRTIAQMWCLRALYFFGVSTQTLHRLYYGRRC